MILKVLKMSSNLKLDRPLICVSIKILESLMQEFILPAICLTWLWCEQEKEIWFQIRDIISKKDHTSNMKEKFQQKKEMS